MIHSPIFNDDVEVKLDDGDRGEKTELHMNVLLQVYLRELHMDMLKKYPTGPIPFIGVCTAQIFFFLSF